MLALCAWCLKDGKSDADSLIGERLPLDDLRVTHGICDAHRKNVEERVARMKADAERAREDAERVRDDAERAREGAERAREGAARAVKDAEQRRDDAEDLERLVDP